MEVSRLPATVARLKQENTILRKATAYPSALLRACFESPSAGGSRQNVGLSDMATKERRCKKRWATDLNDRRWVLIGPLLPEASPQVTRRFKLQLTRPVPGSFLRQQCVRTPPRHVRATATGKQPQLLLFDGIFGALPAAYLDDLPETIWIALWIWIWHFGMAMVTMRSRMLDSRDRQRHQPRVDSSSWGSRGKHLMNTGNLE